LLQILFWQKIILCGKKKFWRKKKFEKFFWSKISCGQTIFFGQENFCQKYFAGKKKI